MEKKTREKIDMIEDIHPMKQITIASIVQVFVLAFMTLSMVVISYIF